MTILSSGTGEFFEAAMLICFGISWPLAVYKTWKAKRVEAKSVGFLAMVFVGYFFGLIGKFVRAPSIAEVGWSFVLYIINGAMVGLDLLLTLHYRKRATTETVHVPPG